MYSPDLPRLMVTRPKRFAIYTPALAGGSCYWASCLVNLESAPVFEPGAAKVNQTSVPYRHILTATGVAAGLTHRPRQLRLKPVFAKSAALNKPSIVPPFCAKPVFAWDERPT